MPRLSRKVADLAEKQRADGSRYFIGKWHDLTAYIKQDAGGQWELWLSENKPAGLRNLAGKERAAAARFTRGQAEASYRGDRVKAAKRGAVARVCGKIATQLDTASAGAAEAEHNVRGWQSRQRIKAE
jgi:hypothetical protein